MIRPDPQTIQVLAAAAGVPVDKETAIRMSNSVGPMFDNFAPIAGTLPLDLEPATFLVVQQASQS